MRVKLVWAPLPPAIFSGADRSKAAGFSVVILYFPCIDYGKCAVNLVQISSSLSTSWRNSIRFPRFHADAPM